MRNVVLLVLCAAFLVNERVVTVKRNGYERRSRLCFYDHLGETYIRTIPVTGVCPVTINVPHPGEDRDGDGEDDGEE